MDRWMDEGMVSGSIDGSSNSWIGKYIDMWWIGDRRMDGWTNNELMDVSVDRCMN